MSLDEALEVAPPRSPASTSATLAPARPASRATRAPTIPAPITTRSNRSAASRSRARPRSKAEDAVPGPVSPCSDPVMDTAPRQEERGVRCAFRRHGAEGKAAGGGGLPPGGRTRPGLLGAGRNRRLPAPAPGLTEA